MESHLILERLAKVMLCGTRATTEPFYNISTLCKRNKKQIYNFSEISKSRTLATPAIYSKLQNITAKLSFSRALERHADHLPNTLKVSR